MKTQASPLNRKQFINSRPATQLHKPMTQVRFIWYVCGLVFASALVAVAVFGMGQ